MDDSISMAGPIVETCKSSFDPNNLKVHQSQIELLNTEIIRSLCLIIYNMESKNWALPQGSILCGHQHSTLIKAQKRTIPDHPAQRSDQ